MAGYILTEQGAEKIERWKEETGKTQEQIALDTALNRATVSKIFQANKPLNKSSIRRLFFGLNLPLDESDYMPIGRVYSDQRIKLNMTDINSLRSTAQSLRNLADKAKERGDSKDAETLKQQAQELDDIADRAEAAVEDENSVE